MTGRRDSKPRGGLPADEVFEDDGVDPRTAFSRIAARGGSEDRKARQAAQLGGAERLRRHWRASAAMNDWRNSPVVAVEPARGAAVLRVVVASAKSAELSVSDEVVVARLRAVRVSAVVRGGGVAAA